MIAFSKLVPFKATAARLRVLAVGEVRKNPEYTKLWVLDDAEDSHHRGGAKATAKTFDEYFEMASGQKFFGDGFPIQAQLWIPS